MTRRRGNDRFRTEPRSLHGQTRRIERADVVVTIAAAPRPRMKARRNRGLEANGDEMTFSRDDEACLHDRHTLTDMAVRLETDDFHRIGRARRSGGDLLDLVH